MNDSKATGIFDQAKGKIEQAAGETFNNQKLANEGAADQVKGHAKETWGNVKDAAHDLGNSNTANTTSVQAQNSGHNMRQDITNAAEHAKDSIKSGLDHLTHKANE